MAARTAAETRRVETPVTIDREIEPLLSDAGERESPISRSAVHANFVPSRWPREQTGSLVAANGGHHE